jgi:hypothetical protein
MRQGGRDRRAEWLSQIIFTANDHFTTYFRAFRIDARLHWPPLSDTRKASAAVLAYNVAVAHYGLPTTILGDICHLISVDTSIIINIE